MIFLSDYIYYMLVALNVIRFVCGKLIDEGLREGRVSG